MRHDVARSTYVKGPSSKSWQVCVFRTGTMGIVLLVFRILTYIWCGRVSRLISYALLWRAAGTMKRTRRKNKCSGSTTRHEEQTSKFGRRPADRASRPYEYSYLYLIIGFASPCLRQCHEPTYLFGVQILYYKDVVGI